MTRLSSSPKKITQQRSCVICRKTSDKKGLLRLVCTADGKVLLDKDFKLPGRGAYIHAEVACVMKAEKSKVWQRVFKRQEIDKETVSALLLEVKNFLMN